MTDNRVLTMLEMQESMNQKVHAEWRHQGFEWYRAIWIECAELMDHHGWKWWKHQSPDTDQIKLELVDIWHFGLSFKLTQGKPLEQLSEEILAEFSAPHEYPEFLPAVEEFTQQVLSKRDFPVARFAGLARLMGMDLTDLFQRYVGKNVLNFFRQDHGYKDGTYIKVWGGREDNEHLMEVLSELDADRKDFREQVYAGLEQRYIEATAATA